MNAEPPTPSAEHVRELLDEDTTLVIPHREFAGVGYLTTPPATPPSPSPPPEHENDDKPPRLSQIPA